MGLFSNLRKQNSVETGTARAMLAIPLLVAAADGKVEESELKEIVNLCSQNAIFHRIGAKVTLDLLQALAKDLNKRGAQAVYQDALAQLSPRMGETALCFAVRVAMADGSLDKSELQALEIMGQGLGIPAERFVQIIEVLLMLHRSDAA